MSYSLNKLESLVARDRTFLFTLTSYMAVLAIYANSIMFKSPVLGGIATILFFLIDSIFLGSAIFKKENAFFKLAFGILLLVMLLGSLNWIAVIIYNLDLSKSTLALLATATISSVLNRRANRKNAV
jgi:uncharacterized membrane protein